MKIIKRFISIVITISLFTVVLSLAVSYFYSDKVANMVIKRLNKNINTQVGIDDYRLSLIKKFPFASLEFKNVIAKTPDNFNKRAVQSTNADTIFSFKNLFLEFNMLGLINNNFSIKALHANNGVVKMLTDYKGTRNYQFWEPKSDTSKTSASLSLQSVKLTNTQLIIINKLKHNHLEAKIKNLTLKGAFYKKQYALSASTKGIVKRFLIDKANFIRNQQVTIETDFSVVDKEYFIKDGYLSIADLKLDLSGFYKENKPEPNELNVNIKSDNISIRSLVSLLPYKIRSKISRLKSDGNIYFKTNIKGKIGRSISPDILGYFGVSNGSLSLSDKNQHIKKIALKGYFSNGRKNSPESSIIIIENVKANMNQSTFTGEAKIKNLKKPLISVSGKTNIDPADISPILNEEQIKIINGNLVSDFNIKLQLQKWKDLRREDIIRLSGDGSFTLKDVSLSFNNAPVSLTGINGALNLQNDHLVTKDFKFLLNNDYYSFTGNINNFIPFLISKTEPLDFNGSIYATNVRIHQYFGKKKKKKKKDTVSMPSRLLGNIHLKADNMIWKDFSASTFNSTIAYKPGMLGIEDINFATMQGRIQGNSFIKERDDQSLLIESEFALSNINISDLFRSFNNFGQDNLQSTHIRGNLSGDIQFRSSTGPDFKLKKETMMSRANITISNGALVDYDPMLSLSKFIKVSELKHIKFSKLNNTFFIRNNKIIIPEMNINSSAIDISGSGEHAFSGDFKYHIKVLLSEVLARKARKAKMENREFGVIAEDGVGKTAIYLIIEGNKKGHEVHYDKNVAKEKRKERFKKEGKTLKNLFHKEFGLFKNDTNLDGPGNKDKDFVIEWDEGEKTKPTPKKNTDANNKKESEFEIEWDDN
jgi:hypothetical protein